jgi:Na+/H+ antiporter NhaD/arsenite permease-like protein
MKGAGRGRVGVGPGIAALTWLLVAVGSGGAAQASDMEADIGLPAPTHSAVGRPVPDLVWVLPFGGLLLAIAVFPLWHPTRHHWESNLFKLGVGLSLGGVVVLYYATRGYGFPHDGHHGPPGLPAVLDMLRHAVLDEYAPFIVLLFSLYVIAGGLRLRGDLLAVPRVNTAFLAIGALLASFVGTTGASMVLIRPLLQTNRDRTRVVHTVVFFIFLVSNIGGCLLPIGDPPLFLGYLRGVPFSWTLSLLAPWAFTVGILLGIYYLWEGFWAFPREPKGLIRAEVRHHHPLRLDGKINLLWLLLVVLAVALIVPGKPLPGLGYVAPEYLREAILILLAMLSLWTTPRGLRRDVEFTYGAILEVAALFLGIFLTMQVPIEILQARGASLGLESPLQFFWFTGGLSSFLDNAPTYVVFFETARTLPIAEGVAHVRLLDGSSIAARLLTAISLGSVFMGANSYIGNGPNFMVKSIAEARGVKMPGFFGYMVYSALILVPLFAVVSWVFLR